MVEIILSWMRSRLSELIILNFLTFEGMLWLTHATSLLVL